MPNPVIAAKLNAVAANAKVLALDYERGKLWEGDLKNRLAQIFADLKDVSNSSEAQR